jgi:folate-binding protein YgfZ
MARAAARAGAWDRMAWRRLALRAWGHGVGHDNSAMTPAVPNGVTTLSHLGVIRAEGPDAASFLHGQLTQDIVLMTSADARLAALCTPKGRMLASFVVIRPSPELVLLVLSRDILAQTLKRLSMFVLRAKVKLTDATDDFALHGLLGKALADHGIEASLPPGRRVAIGVASVVTLHPADGVSRALWIAPSSEPAPAGEVLDPALWQWSEVRSGVATLSAPVVEAFVPQMLNYESVDGVNFRKGCYPGQEIVARSQFRGTLKRRAYLVGADAALQAGQEVFAASDAEQPVGTVVQAAPGPDGRWSALVSMQTSAPEGGGLRTAGAALVIEPLPYALRDDI